MPESENHLTLLAFAAGVPFAIGVIAYLAVPLFKKVPLFDFIVMMTMGIISENLWDLSEPKARMQTLIWGTVALLLYSVVRSRDLGKLPKEYAPVYVLGLISARVWPAVYAMAMIFLQ